MSVHYKFKSSKDAHTVTFDGLYISVADLKKAIMQQKKIGKSSDLDLQITNAETKEVYESDTALIPKNTSVTVARVPVSGNQKKSWDKHDHSLATQDTNSTRIDFDKITKSSNLSNSQETEEEKIKTMMSQSTQDYDPSKYVKSRGLVGPLPSNYTCYRCGQPGHYIKHCPTNNIDVKRSTGIPRSFMIPANPDQKGALLTASGEYAVPKIDHEAYKEVKKEKPPFLPSSDTEEQISDVLIPEDLQCMICHDLLQDAVLISCCGNSYCDECIRTALLESDVHQCPTCLQMNISPDTLIPNRFLRNAVSKFRNETGYTQKVKTMLGPKLSLQEMTGASETGATNETSQVNQADIQTTPSETNAKSEPPEHLESLNLKDDIDTKDNIMNDENMNDIEEKQEANLSPSEETANISQETNDKKGESNDEEKSGHDHEEKNVETSDKENPSSDNAEVVNQEATDAYEGATNIAENYDASQVHSIQEYVPSQGYGVRQRMVGNLRAIHPIGQSGRPSILPHPRMYRSGMNQDSRFYRPHMRDPYGYSMSMGPSPYGYHPMRPGFSDPYTPSPYVNSGLNHMPNGPMQPPVGIPMQSYAEAPPGATGMGTDGCYQYGATEYVDPLDSFAKHLESRSRKRRSHSRNSSGSSSSDSSYSDFSDYSYRRRSRSRSHHRRYSRSRSPRRRYRYERSRSKSRSRSPYRHSSYRSSSPKRSYREGHESRYSGSSRRYDSRPRRENHSKSSGHRCSHKKHDRVSNERENDKGRRESHSRSKSKEAEKDDKKVKVASKICPKEKGVSAEGNQDVVKTKGTEAPVEKEVVEEDIPKLEKEHVKETNDSTVKNVLFNTGDTIEEDNKKSRSDESVKSKSSDDKHAAEKEQAASDVKEKTHRDSDKISRSDQALYNEKSDDKSKATKSDKKSGKEKDKYKDSSKDKDRRSREKEREKEKEKDKARDRREKEKDKAGREKEKSRTSSKKYRESDEDRDLDDRKRHKGSVESRRHADEEGHRKHKHKRDKHSGDETNRKRHKHHKKHKHRSEER